MSRGQSDRALEGKMSTDLPPYTIGIKVIRVHTNQSTSAHKKTDLSKQTC